MTAPAVQAPPAQAQPAPPQQPAPGDAGLITLVVAALAAYGTAEALAAALRAPLRAAGIGRAALAGVSALTVAWPPEPLEGTGPAQRQAVRQNLVRRAAFLLAAARRVQQAVTAARSQGQPALAAAGAALTAEKRYLAQHVAAGHQRMRAAAAVDGMAAAHGALLGWNTVKDTRTTAECYAADKRNFRADRPPLIGYPGATHPNCRCFPSAPFKGARLLPAAGDSARSLTTAA